MLCAHAVPASAWSEAFSSAECTCSVTLSQIIAAEAGLCLAQGVGDTALPHVTHLHVSEVLSPGESTNYTFDWTAAAEHMPRLQHITFEIDNDRSHIANLATPWFFVCPPFPVTLLGDVCTDCAVSVCAPKLAVRLPDGGLRELEQKGSLHKIWIFKRPDPDCVTLPFVQRPTLHLPGTDPKWCLRKQGAQDSALSSNGVWLGVNQQPVGAVYSIMLPCR